MPIDTALLRDLCGRTLERTDFAGLGRREEGKVRDSYVGEKRRTIVVTDRVSCFDVVVGTIPLKGQVLNQLAAFWFEKTRALAPNHLISVPDPNVSVVRELEVLPVEFVMRGHLTGVTSTSIWTAYERGDASYCGHVLPKGLRKHERLPEPLLTPTTKAKIDSLVTALKAAFHARIATLDWMSQATREQALKKLDTYQIKVGYPDHPRDYSSLLIRDDDLLGDARCAGALDWQFYVDRFDGPVDRTDWLMTPQTNDAYNGSLRDIVFPAGILQPPVFDANADMAINYGAAGAIIGHELMHGFDDAGRAIDADGVLRDWWQAADAKAFEARAKMLAAQYSVFQVFSGIHVNGELTLGENIADLGGVVLALDAYRLSLGGKPAPVIDGFTGDQRVFIGWAQAFRRKATDDAIKRQVASDPHSPPAFRVNGPMRNIDAWYAAFGVGSSDKLYVPPEKRVRIW